MTIDEATSPWTEPGYGDLSGVTRRADEIEVTFGNGDVIQIASRQLGIHGDFTVAPAEGEECLAIAIAAGGEVRTVSWLQLRALSDPEFAREMRRQDAEEARRLGSRLRALREDRELSQKDLAALVGMPSPQLSKIEKGNSDLRYSTVQSLIRSLGATLADISGPDAPELSQKAIRKHSKEHGVDNEFMDRLFSFTPRLAVSSLLERAFGWSIRGLAAGTVSQPSAAGLVFKSTRQQDASASPLVSLAQRVADVVHDHAVLVPYQDVPRDAEQVRVELGRGAVQLPALLRWAWNRGIAVIPLHGKKGFCAAAWTVGDAPMIVLKETRPLPAFWLFDLAHEIGHIANNHLDSDGIVDVEDLRPGESTPGMDDDQERDANEYALRLLLGDYRAILNDVRKETRGHYLRFKDAVATVARKWETSVGLLGMVAAYEFTDIGEPKDRWGSATNLARTEGDGRAIATQYFVERVDFSRMTDLDRWLLDTAVGSPEQKSR
ncbi:helix-turn-helix domain-containing protein [Candidatus Poriferisodalis sp.]|uniref:helix-turn-helix domain-containing protein n=1 Tax=Candidatus Poriferisodalis sp. TaxID=3101277 RepID=UPI003B01DCD9